MSAAFEIASPVRRQPVATAEIVTGSRVNHPPVDAVALRVGRRGVVLADADTLALGAFAWVRMTLPTGGRIRPLVRVTGRTEQGTACRFVHVFPNERRLLDGYHESHATPHGY